MSPLLFCKTVAYSCASALRPLSTRSAIRHESPSGRIHQSRPNRPCPATKFACYTVTQNDPRFFERMEKLTGNKAGRNGITTLPDSNWVLSLILNTQPYYQNQPKDVYTFYGITLFQDKVGNFVKKKVSECTGRGRSCYGT